MWYNSQIQLTPQSGVPVDPRRDVGAGGDADHHGEGEGGGGAGGGAGEDGLAGPQQGGVRPGQAGQPSADLCSAGRIMRATVASKA